MAKSSTHSAQGALAEADVPNSLAHLGRAGEAVLVAETKVVESRCGRTCAQTVEGTNLVGAGRTPKHARHRLDYSWLADDVCRTCPHVRGELVEPSPVGSVTAW